MILLEPIKSELDKVSWSQLIQWGSYVGVPFAGWLFSRIIQTMPEPSISDSKKYIWLYRILQSIGANPIHSDQAKFTLQVKTIEEEGAKNNESQKAKTDEEKKSN